MSAEVLLNAMLQSIQAKGKMSVLDRLRKLWGDEQITEEERRVDVMFVYKFDDFFDDFPVSDEGLLMYVAYTSGLELHQVWSLVFED